MACHLHNTPKSIQNVFSWAAKRISKLRFQWCVSFVSVWRRTNSWIRVVTHWSDRMGAVCVLASEMKYPAEKLISMCYAVNIYPAFSSCLMFPHPQYSMVSYLSAGYLSLPTTGL